MQLDVEMGNEGADVEERRMMECVHYTMRYVVKDGNDMSPEMMDVAMGVLTGVAREASGVPKISAMHMVTLILNHRGEFAFAQAYARMTQDEMKRTELVEQSGIEYQ
jgi:hypothetical protein